MKPTLPFALIILLLSLPGARAAAPVGPLTPAGDAEHRPPERVEVQVLKVYNAADSGGIFRAYAVRWKDQEIIVSDSLAKTNYKVGDRITILAMNHPYPQGKEPHRLLSFTVIPSVTSR